jgi:hypothetical protein
MFTEGEMFAEMDASGERFGEGFSEGEVDIFFVEGEMVRFFEKEVIG